MNPCPSPPFCWTGESSASPTCLLLLLYYLFTSSYTLSYSLSAHPTVAKGIVLVTTYACFITSAFFFFLSELDYPGETDEWKGELRDVLYRFMLGLRIADTSYLLFSRSLCMYEGTMVHWLTRVFGCLWFVCSRDTVCLLLFSFGFGTGQGWKLGVRSMRKFASAFPGVGRGPLLRPCLRV
jgi:hypothetical protein